MKFKFVATKKDVVIFAIFAVFLLYVIAIGVLNVSSLASTSHFYGLNPLEAFSPTYIYYTILFYILALVGLFLCVDSYFFEFEEGVGFKLDGRSGGYSNWAKAKEIKTDKNVKRIVASDEKADYAGVPLISNGKELWVDDGEYHTLVIGATGSGKTQDTVLPTIRVLAKKGESIVVTDPKGEIYEKAGGLLKQKGYNILLLNFRNPQNGNSWNPLDLPYRLFKNGNQDKAIELLDDLALNILYDESSANSDPFWERTAADYFAGLALAMFEDTTEDKININSINMTATVGEDKFGGSTYIKEYFSYKDPSSAAYVNASGTVMAPSETKGGIISVFKQKVKLFASRENLSEMLSHSDFSLDSIGTRPTAVFIIIQDEKKTYHSLATIFIKQVYETLIDVAQAHGGKLPCRTNFILDEFANMPPLKDVTTMITAARSRQIRFTMIIQNFAQLNKVYGKDDAETIKGNCGNIIYLISTELAALEEISKLCGDKKSKKDDKTASTPLVTVSDLQRMKQFDHILLRMRKSPFKTSFVPDFKIDWGNCKSPKVEYPVREKKPVEIFDIREFVKEKKNQKINEMMASMGGDMPSSGTSLFGGSSSSGGGARFPMMPPREKASGSPNKSEISVNDLVRRIDEKIAELEKSESEELEAEARKNKPKDTSSEKISTSSKEEKTVKDKKEKVEILDDDDDDLHISTSELERKINEKLSNELVSKEEIDNKIEKQVDKVVDAKIEEKMSDIDKDIKNEKSNKSLEPFFISTDEIERKVNEKLSNELSNNKKELDDKIEKQVDKVIDAKIEEKIEEKKDEYKDELESKINSRLQEIDDNARRAKMKDNFVEKEVPNSNSINYNPYKVTKEEDEAIEAIDNEVNKLKEHQANSAFKPTSTIKLSDASDDERFFDDFFDD